MGHKIRPEDVRIIAETLLAHDEDDRFRYAFVGCSPSTTTRGEWSAVFDVFTSDGALIDGPIVVIVDEKTRKARVVVGP